VITVFDEKHGQCAAGVGVAQDFVHGLIGEQGGVGIDAAGGERRVAADKQPEVGVADDGH
jgi:hypothetical protein